MVSTCSLADWPFSTFETPGSVSDTSNVTCTREAGAVSAGAAAAGGCAFAPSVLACCNFFALSCSASRICAKVVTE
jgi:hypothetical protein